MAWDEIQRTIQACRFCADRRVDLLRVPDGPQAASAVAASFADYFPGNNRHKGFDEIVADLRNLLAIDF
jgi:hypothetical protein